MSKQLDDWSKQYGQEGIPELAIQDAIELGVNKAKVMQARRRRHQLSLVAFFSFWLVLTMLINVSPAFANQLGNIPGMGQFVEFFQFDQGKLAAVENNYYQPIEQKIEAGPFSFTIEGAIRDSRDLVLFYTLKGERGMEDLSFNIEDVKANGVAIEDYSLSYGFGREEDQSDGIYDTITLSTVDPIEAADLELEVMFIGMLDEKEITEQASIPIKAEVMGGEQRYELNKTVVVEGQTLYIHGVTIFPLKVEVEISADPNNTMRILGIDDLALIDEDGDSWTTITNGMVGFGDLEDGGMRVYLQSNYFESPESLTLFFSKIQAVPKDADYLLIDLEKEQILHDPYEKFSQVEYNGRELSLTYDQVENNFNSFIANEVISQHGEVINIDGFSFFSQFEDQHVFRFNMKTDEPIVELKLDAYPYWLEEAVHIKLY